MRFKGIAILFIIFSFNDCKSSMDVNEIKERTGLDLFGKYYILGESSYEHFRPDKGFVAYERSKNKEELLSFEITQEGKLLNIHNLMPGREKDYKASFCEINSVNTKAVEGKEFSIDCYFDNDAKSKTFLLYLFKYTSNVPKEFMDRIANKNDLFGYSLGYYFSDYSGRKRWENLQRSSRLFTSNPNRLFKDQNLHPEQSNFDLSVYPIGSVFKVSEETNLRTLLNAYLTDAKLASKVMNDLEISGNEFEINEKSKKYEAIRKKEIVYVENFGLSLGKYDFNKQGYHISVQFGDSVGGYFGQEPFEFTGIYSDTIFFPISEADAKNTNLSDYTYSGLFKPKLSIEKEKYAHCNSKGITIVTTKEFMDMASNVDPTIVCKEKVGSFAKVKLNLVKFKLLNKNNEVILEKGK